MARYEVVARTRPDPLLSNAAYIDLALKSGSLDKAMHLQRVEQLPDGNLAIVLRQNLSARKTDAACAMANRSLAQLGIPAGQIQQIDLLRLDRKHGRTLVRSWTTPPGGDPSGDREPRRPKPAPPHLNASLD